MKYPQRKRLHLLPAWLFSVTLVIINVIRILRVPITMDETGYRANDSYLDLLTEKYPSANNHILHSLIRKFFVENFSDHIFFLRIDLLAAQIAFLITTYLLCSYLVKNTWWCTIAFFVINLFSPLLFQFWGLSRGYGLGISFMIISVYHLMRYYDEQRALSLIICLASGILATMSNFSLLNYIVALYCTLIANQILYYAYSNRKKHLKKEWLIILISIVVLAGLIVKPLSTVKSGGELQFLGSNGFFKDTIMTIAQSNMMTPNTTAILWVSYIGFAFICLQGIYWLICIIRLYKDRSAISTLQLQCLTLYALVAATCIGLILQHLILKINYVIDRAALFLGILIIVQFIFWLRFLWNTKPVITSFGLVVLLAFTVYNFCADIDIYSTYLWWYNREDITILNKITNEWGNNKSKIKLGISWLYTATFDYDIRRYFPGRFGEIVEYHDEHPGMDTTIDYYYINKDDISHFSPIYVQDTVVIGGSFILFRKTHLK